jgi:hypothetical protein
VVDDRYDDHDNERNKIIPLAMRNVFSVRADEIFIQAPLSVIRGPYMRPHTYASGRICPPITYINVMYDVRTTPS